MLLANNIYFKRNKIEILNNINISISPNKILYIQGKNGSGKTTLLKILTNILKPKKGEVFWKGKNIKKNPFNYYKDVTFIMDNKTSNINLTVKENIMFWSKLFSSKTSIQQINSALKLLSLDKYQNTLVGNLSYGEIKKLELSRLIIEQKKLWILDEPYIGLDNYSIGLINQSIINHVEKGGMTILTSHIPPDINDLEILNLDNYENS